ncbi:MAG: YraN family protein [Alphaproteobacteria bacterium]|nr:YraN family protein [Alphaproteobacteria bacterium]
MNNYHKGRLAEFLARFYMIMHGYRILERNYIIGKGTTAGEIDFIAKKRNYIVFVEVKQRQNLDSAAYAITSKQQQRLIRGAECFIRNNQKYQGFDLRFDAILITLPFQIRHIKNAWTA